MSYQQQREEAKKPSASTKVFGFIYFIVVVVVAYYFAGLAVEQIDPKDLASVKIPVMDEPIPELGIRIGLTLIIFFVLQFISVFVFGLFKGREKNAPKSPYDQW